MNKRAVATAIGLALLSGCQSTPPPQQQFVAPQGFPPAPAAPMTAAPIAPAVPAAAPVGGTPVSLTAQQIASIQEGVRAQLKDPGSAIFTGPTFAAQRPDGEMTACGTVNAKNSYGGYVGASPYIATVRGGVVVDSASSPGNSGQILIQMCRERGVAI